MRKATHPSDLVGVLFCLTCAAIGALFLLLVFHTIGPGTSISDPLKDHVMEVLGNKTVVQCVCSTSFLMIFTLVANGRFLTTVTIVTLFLRFP